MATLQDLLDRLSSVHKPALSLADDNVPLPPGKTMGEVVRRLYEKRSSSLPPIHEALSSSSSNMVAVCIVIVDELHHEAIWREWLKTGKWDSNQPEFWGELFIHAKHPEKLTSPWVKERTLDHSFRPEWNSPEVVKAILSTLDAALQFTRADGKKCGRFVLATESCLPIYSLQQVGQQLFANDKSWLAAYDTPKNRYEAAHCFQAVRKDLIPPSAVWKSLPGWIMLSRAHCAEIVALVKRLGGWRQDQPTSNLDGSLHTEKLLSMLGTSGQWNESKGGVHAPEEMFFATMLAVLGYLRKTGDDQVLRQPVTFAEWKRNGDANPVAFPSLTADLLSRIRNVAPSALFARKFPPGSASVGSWSEVVLSRVDGLGRSRAKKRSANDVDRDSKLEKQEEEEGEEEGEELSSHSGRDR